MVIMFEQVNLKSIEPENELIYNKYYTLHMGKVFEFSLLS